MAEDSTQTQTTSTTEGESTTTQTAGGQQATDSTTGAATQTATSTTEAQTQTTKIDTSSPEFKAALTEAIKAKLPQLQRQAKAQVAKELSGEKEGEPTVDELKTKLSERDAKLRVLEARDQLESFIADKRNQLQVRNVRGLFKLIKDDLEYDEEGKVTNFKDVIAAAKSEAAEFFGGQASSIDAGVRAQQNGSADMNQRIRALAGRG